MVYGIGQADNLVDLPYVAMPKYTNGSLSKQQYPCDYVYPNLFDHPQQIPLGSYVYKDDAYPNGYNNVREPYVSDTQHKSAGEFTDIELFLMVVVLLVITGSFVMFRK